MIHKTHHGETVTLPVVGTYYSGGKWLRTRFPPLALATVTIRFPAHTAVAIVTSRGYGLYPGLGAGARRARFEPVSWETKEASCPSPLASE